MEAWKWDGKEISFIAKVFPVIRKSTWHIVASFRCQLLLFLLFSSFAKIQTLTTLFVLSCISNCRELFHFLFFVISSCNFNNGGHRRQPFFCVIFPSIALNTFVLKQSRTRLFPFHSHVHRFHCSLLYSKWFMDHVIVMVVVQLFSWENFCCYNQKSERSRHHLKL